MQVSIKRVEPQSKITLQESAGLAIITINRPHLRNALTSRMWDELTHLGKRILDNPKNRVVIIRGNGPHFTAGSDIKEFSQMTLEEAEEAFVRMEKAISTFERLPLPTIGVVNGPAMGAGFVFALACDLRIGSNNTQMGIPVGRLGITLNDKFVKRIVDLIGPSRAKDLVYTGRLFNAEECYQLGLINYLVETERLDRFAFELGKKISSQSPASVYAVKRSVASSIPGINVPWGDPRQVFVDPYDFPEGIRAFVEKRSPQFKDRRGQH
ncbi:enoyl-CoA hydratase/carnithine racemase [Caldalkalibacillus uzonensis]|uniref:Enoyl-CoA hydratase/carnithine racemase n=1 Tax=Caldalkalibacillus uzonensis TaxID=353224 RepID=A0ABU0CPX2_9BACI|nr:enoyl-CoA hydratase/isomerase family protein [Caldalkalibacillus uzonensis]MDQ0338202.1 enoyl-CoA hydratase/carnithine racemase [Caldalkalibacillus uzonensis]